MFPPSLCRGRAASAETPGDSQWTTVSSALVEHEAHLVNSLHHEATNKRLHFIIKAAPPYAPYTILDYSMIQVHPLSCCLRPSPVLNACSVFGFIALPTARGKQLRVDVAGCGHPECSVCASLEPRLEDPLRVPLHAENGSRALGGRQRGMVRGRRPSAPRVRHCHHRPT